MENRWYLAAKGGEILVTRIRWLRERAAIKMFGP
jgi:hypothetical protein